MSHTKDITWKTFDNKSFVELTEYEKVKQQRDKLLERIRDVLSNYKSEYQTLYVLHKLLDECEADNES